MTIEAIAAEMTTYRAASTFSGRSTRAWDASRSNRPERKNPLTFESYAELRDLFRALERRRTCARS